jgi:PAS domain S-box-containing protein
MTAHGSPPCNEFCQPKSFERLLAELSTFFINLPADRIDNGIVAAQGRFCEALGLQRSSLFQVPENEPGTLRLTHWHQPSDMPPLPDKLRLDAFFPWATRKALRGETIMIAKIADLPAEAACDRENLHRFGTRSVVGVPLLVGSRKVLGLLTFADLGQEREWSETDVQHFEMVAQIFASAISRRQAQKALEDRGKFEMLLADISTRFINIPADGVGRAIEDAQRRVCECLGIDLCALWEWSADAPQLLTMTHIYRIQDDPPLPEQMDAEEYFPWSRQEMLAGRTISVSSMAELLPQSPRDVESYRHFGIKSTCVFPLALGNGPPIGALGFNTLKAEYAWPEEIVTRLQLVAQMFAGALARERAEHALVSSEKRLRLITNALPVLISYVGTDLRYRFNNEAYRAWFGVGPEEARGRTVPEVTGESFYNSFRPYIEQALAGERVRCALEVELADGRPLSVEAIYVPDVDEQGMVRGIYVMALDVTERNLARQETRRLQDELFHAGRVSALGELAGALAHEINQPLSAIMSNAQAARRFLDHPTPSLEEVQEILKDIALESSRASEVINHLRALLKKEKWAFAPLDLNLVLREVVTLLTSDAKRRGTWIALVLEPRLPAVRGDRIHLQQVALNLVLNAFEAMKERPEAERRVRIRTWRQGSQILTAVTDSGNGLPAGATDKIFEAFYTTKPSGLGMGLCICRSIIDAHRGRLWVENNADRGATFFFSLPADTG